MPLVAVLIGSQSDAPVMEPCLHILSALGIDHELHVISAHRNPEKVREFASTAAERGFQVIIAAAGMAAHLPGAVAAWTTLPVIGVPISAEGRSASGGGKPGMSGLDALLSIAQMPPGLPVACMAVNGTQNAALFAAAILALKHPQVREALERYRREQSQS